MPTCFIISPIGETGSDIRTNADDLRDLIIQPALELFGFDIIRGDHRSEAGQIDVDVIRAVQESELCVIDLSLPNPNVYYEFGRRDETGKPIILLKAKGSGDLPVDIATRRYIEYDLDSRHGIRDAIQQLKNFVEPLVKRGFESVGSGASLSDIADTLKRVERKLDRLGDSNRGTITGVLPKDLGNEDPFAALKLAIRQGNIPLAEQAMEQLKYRKPLYNWLDYAVEQVAALGSVRAGDILLEHLGDFMDRQESTLKQKVEYLSCLVSNLNATDREGENLELLEKISANILASAPEDAYYEKVTVYNQMNRIYYGLYFSTDDEKWLDKSIDSLRKALDISDNYAFLHNNLAQSARLRNRPGDLAVARDHIIRCIELCGEDVDPDYLEEACTIFHLLNDPRLDDYMERLVAASPIKAQLLSEDWKN